MYRELLGRQRRRRKRNAYPGKAFARRAASFEPGNVARAVLVASTLALLISGCRLPMTACHPQNVVAIDAQGSLLTPKKIKDGLVVLEPTEHPDVTRVRRLFARGEKAEETRVAKRQAYYAKSRQYLEDIFNSNAALDRHTNITIFIHGGLNETVAAVERAAPFADSNFAKTNRGTYPNFVCWKPSLILASGGTDLPDT